MSRGVDVATGTNNTKSRMRGLTPAGVKVLDRLREGSAYWVRDKWRFRGGRGGARTSTVDVLLDLGFAQRLDSGSFHEIRITAHGRNALNEHREDPA